MRPFHADDASDLAQAAALLHEGFPERPMSFWLAALHRVQRLADNRAMGQPLGYFMLNQGQAVGVALTPASWRERADGTRVRLVNISSWYVRPDFRWRAGVMLRAIMADKSCIYTDLTPTPEVQKMLPVVGMQPINLGVAIHCLPLLALKPAGAARARWLGPTDALPAPVTPALWRPLPASVQAHRELGCTVLSLGMGTGTDGDAQLLVLRALRVRGLAAAQVVFCDSQERLLRDLGALARCLLARGVALLVCDTRQARSTATALFRPRERWFARGDNFEGRTDVLGSELCLILGAGAQA